ncbi:MAG: bifunctional class I SAM-dependent methyltransferase/glycosyltransferase family 2 protein [Kiritimatiellae bacterium]|nr:bifunctional class I SAM-dependent methyltransferase/glycosyltransferase family 2 protein [Kiritimatiellia bacterium]
MTPRKRQVAELFDHLAEQPMRVRSRVAGEYYRCLSQMVRRFVPCPGRVLDLGCGNGDLLAELRPVRGVGVDISRRMIEMARRRHPELEFVHGDAETVKLDGCFDTVLAVNLIGQLEDVYACLKNARSMLDPGGRIIIVYYNHLWEPVLRLASWLRLRAPVPCENWLPLGEVENLLELTGYQVVRSGRRVLCPVYIPLLSWFLNTWVSPLPFFQRLSLVEYVVARPLPAPDPERVNRLTCSVIVPTRNERGNIQAAVERIPPLGAHTEIIFVDGNSTDGTVEEIRRMIRERPDLDIKFLSQGDGRGKADAVRKGFTVATGDVLMILDSDLTMPPEDLPKYLEVLATGRAEFVNGSRLVYPMETEAMRFLNKLANHFFGRLFSWLLEQPLRDTLCGTKVLFRDDYLRIAANRAYFGEFDPFGDFDLLFGAARLNLKIVDLPIRYRQRTYGEIKIQRFRHGWLLLKMSLFAARKLKFL